MRENLNKEVDLIYDATETFFQVELEVLESYMSQRAETIELNGGLDQELEDLLPDVELDIGKMRKAVQMLADKEVRSKWVTLIQDNLSSEISQEDIDVLESAAKIEDRIQEVYQSGSEILVAWVAKESNDEVVVQ